LDDFRKDWEPKPSQQAKRRFQAPRGHFTFIECSGMLGGGNMGKVELPDEMKNVPETKLRWKR
jgi:hypothetical protein